MKKHTLYLSLAAAVLLLFTGLTSCELFQEEEKESLAVTGEWTPSYGSILITGSAITWYDSSGNLSYSAAIASYENDSWNGSETGKEDYGYMAVQYDAAPSWNTSIKDMFMIVRWQKLETNGGTTTFEYSEGYNGGIYFNSEEEAVSGATSANGYFNSFSSATKTD